jgi:glycosyltransferase involved in cell wall biosynthesis
MNPVYAVLGSPFWKMWRKKTSLWYNHPMGSMLAIGAIRLSDSVFCTSSHAFARRFKKTRLMPAGIDTSMFRKIPDAKKTLCSILYLGRISPIKKLEYLIKAAEIIDRRGINFNLHITGSPVADEDYEYERQLRRSACVLEKKGRIKFYPQVSNTEAPSIYNQHEIFVNLTPDGSFDKTVLEAMACETLVMVSNRSFKDMLSEEFIFENNNPEDLADKLCYLLQLPQLERKQHGESLRQQVFAKHSLDKLVMELKSTCSAGHR